MSEGPALRRPLIAAPFLLAFLGACVGPGGRIVALDDARDDTATFPRAETAPPDPAGPVPAEPEKDWVELTSGEWLRGTLLRIQRDELDFDSESLGEVSVALDDVRKIRTSADQALVTEGQRALHGRIVLEGDDLWIEGERTVALDRDQLFAVLALHDGRAIDWTGRVTLGATTRSGNTNQNDLNGFVELLRESARTTWRTTYNGVVSRAGGVETANNHRLRSVHDVYLSRRLFITPPTFEAYRDRFQNIDTRIVAGATVGVRVVDGADQRWTVSTGPAYQFTRLETPAPGEEREDGSLAGVLRSEYTWDVADDVELGLDYQLNLSLEDASDYNHNLLARLSVGLLGDLTLDVVFVWDRVNEPRADAEGAVPLPDDYRTTVGLGWSF